MRRTYQKKKEKEKREGFPSKEAPIKRRKKYCFFCTNDIPVDYKDVENLRRYVAGDGKIFPRRLTGACSRHQRAITRAIKRARDMALLPFIGRR